PRRAFVASDARRRGHLCTVGNPHGIHLKIGESCSDKRSHFCFPGQYCEQESTLCYNYYRSYMASMGRYPQPDRIGLQGGPNRYPYADGNTLANVDPDGLIAWGVILAAADLGWQLYQHDGNLRCVDWAGVGLSMVGGGLLNALGKGAFRFKTVGSHTWDATRSWMNRRGIQMPRPGEQRHHWLFERNQGIGKNVPDVMKNQPFNTNPISAGFNNWLARHPELAWLGGPSWAPELLLGGMVTVGSATTSGAQDECSCRR
ncbi:RHS repeat-associated core domain-containing protein, partial [Ramlibacter albus]